MYAITGQATQLQHVTAAIKVADSLACTAKGEIHVQHVETGLTVYSARSACNRLSRLLGR